MQLHSIEIEMKTERTQIFLVSTANIVLAVNTAQEVMKIGHRDITCFNLEVEGDIMTPLEKFAAHRSSGAIIVISGVESLPVNERSRLNFLHGATDSNSPFPQLAVFLTWDLTKRPVPDETSYPLFVESFVNEGGRNINARALVGRFKLIDLSGNDNDDPTPEFRGIDICSFFAPPTFSDTEPFDFTFITVIAIVIGVMYVMVQINSSTNEEKIIGDENRSMLRCQPHLTEDYDHSVTPSKATRSNTGVDENLEEEDEGPLHAGNDSFDELSPRRSSRIAATHKRGKKYR